LEISSVLFKVTSNALSTGNQYLASTPIVLDAHSSYQRGSSHNG
jgi:hypothetical protein